jgi:hypothetical protein
MAISPLLEPASDDALHLGIDFTFEELDNINPEQLLGTPTSSNSSVSSPVFVSVFLLRTPMLMKIGSPSAF